MRIAITCNTSWNLVNFRASLIKGWLSAGHEVLVWAPHDTYAAQLSAWGCQVVDLPMQNRGTNPVHDALLIWRYVRLIRRFQPDAICSWTIKPNVYGGLAARLLGVPLLANVSGLGTSFLSGGWLARLTQRLYAVAFRRAQAVFFQNPDDRALFQQQGLVHEPQAQLLPGSGIDLARFAPATREPLAGRPFRFLMIARLLRDKGVLEYVEAARQLRAQGLPVVCQYLGFVDVANPTAIAREQLQAWVEEGVLAYLGSTDDVRPWIAQADGVVLPSYREGTPRTLLEAAAMARPLIATDVPGCREVVRHGVNGYLCAVRSATALAEAMRRLALLSHADWQDMAYASRSHAAAHFDEQQVLKAYAVALQRIHQGR